MGYVCVDCVQKHRAGARPVVNNLGFKVTLGRPLATFSLIGANIAFYLYGIAVMGGAQWQLTFGFIPALALTEPWRWITSAFVHDTGFILHIGLNMLMLWVFGRQVEGGLGLWRFLTIYGTAVIAAGVAIMLLAPAVSLHVGASGGVFGVIVAYILMSRKVKANVNALMIQAGAWLVVGVFVAGISWQGHLGGAIGGAVATWIFLTQADRTLKARQ